MNYLRLFGFLLREILLIFIGLVVLKFKGVRIFSPRAIERRDFDSVSIFGSGSSVLDIDKTELDCPNSLKIGFNLWCYHDVVPDVYFFEVKPKELYINRHQFEIFERKKGQYKDTIFVCQGLQLQPIREQLKAIHFIQTEFPKDLLKNLQYSMLFRTMHQSSKFSLLPISLFYRNKRMLNSRGVFFFMRGTLSTSLDLALALSHKVKIYGFDLTTEHYFSRYEPDSGFDFEPLPNRQENQNVHTTANPARGLPTISFVLSNQLKHARVDHDIEMKGLVTRQRIEEDAQAEMNCNWGCTR